MLKSESRELIKNYVNIGVLEKSKIADIWGAEDGDSIIVALKNFISISDTDIDIIWRNVRSNWRGCDNKENKMTMFNEEESWFFHKMLLNKGLMTRDFCLKNLGNSSYLNDKIAENLCEMGYINIFKLKNWQVVYLLNLEFYNEVFKQCGE